MTLRRIASRIGTPLQQLRWKLTFSYTAVTVGALLIVELLLLAGLMFGIRYLTQSAFFPRLMDDELNQVLIPQLREDLSESDPNVESMRRLLDLFDEGTITTSEEADVTLTNIDTSADGWLFVLDDSGTLLATNGISFPDSAIGERFDPAPIEGLAGPLRATLAGETELEERYTFVDERMILVMPIYDEAGTNLLGALGFIMPLPLPSLTILGELLPIIGVSLILFTIGAGLAGTVFGFMTSRALVRRLDRISTAADAWSRGNFAVFITDRSGDELSQLAHRMNRMAEQLENFLEARNRLAILEERNRLARDLHDSAKQQAFAASAQLGAARALLKQDLEAAEQHITEAEELTYALRQELTGIIKELRPVALDKKGLAQALRDYADEWAARENIQAHVRVKGERFIPLEIEQTLYRIAQEALANVARHSGSDRVDVSLTYGETDVRMAIVDYGAGFDTTQAPAGFGLKSMRERASMLPGGEITINSQPGHGTQIDVYSQTRSLKRGEPHGKRD